MGACVSCSTVGTSGGGVVSSGSVEKPAATVASYGGVQGLHNPLDWNSVPSVLQEKFPHWKDNSPAGHKSQSQAANQGVYAWDLVFSKVFCANNGYRFRTGLFLL